MPAISKIRLTNVVYEDGDKRFNDDVFLFDGYNGAILLENGGGKTVFIHTVLQAVLPHTDLGERKIKETLQLDQAPAHIAIEWIVNDKPRRYLVTAVSLFLNNNQLQSYRYAFEYEHGHPDRIEQLPFAVETRTHNRPAYKEEISDYYSRMRDKTHHARTFDTLRAFHEYIEENYQIIHNEWESIVKINRDEGGIEKFFENCRTTTDLYDRLLIPIVEDSIAGYEKHTFADTFEKQRTAFQTYRNLQKSMEEHEAIQRELDSYVQEFKHFSEKQTAYKITRQQAKGLMETIVKDRLMMEKEQAENEGDWTTWESTYKHYEMKLASFGILQEQEKAHRLEATYIKQLDIHDEVKKQLDKNDKLYHSLMHAKAQQEVSKYEQLKEQYRQEIEHYEADSNISDFEDALSEENGKLHGYFLIKIDELQKQIEQIKIECRPLQEAIVAFRKKEERIEGEREKASQRYNRVLGLIESKEGDLNRLKQVLANPDQEDMKTECDKWTVRRQWLDEEIIRLNKWCKTAEQTVNDLEKNREQLRGKVHKADIKIHEKLHIKHQMKLAQDQLNEQLAEIRPNWQTVDLHLQESRLRGALNDLLANIRREREDVLYKERLAHRFVDDYDNQDLFIADAFLAERLKSWQNQFYVTSGTEFYDNLSEEDRQYYATYPLWPLTLVTTSADKDKLLENLKIIEERLQYPISVLTLEEVKQLGHEEIDGTWIAPQHWKANLNEEKFVHWKKELREVAVEATRNRENMETILEEHLAILRQFEDFFKTYPREKIEKLREDIHQIEAGKKIAEREIDEFDQKVKKTKQDIVVSQEQVAMYKDEMQGLDGKIEKAIEYFQVERELKELSGERTELEQKNIELTEEISQLNREIGRYETDKLRLDEAISDNERDLYMIKENDLYKEVNEERPIYTDEDRAVILKRRENLQYQIRGIQQAYGELVAKYEQAEKEIAREQRIIEGLVRDHKNIDVQMTFPVNGERLLERAREDMLKGQKEAQHLAIDVAKVKEKFDRQDALVNHLLKQFRDEFSQEDIYEFNLTIEAIDLQLKEEHNQLTERKAYIQSEKYRIEKQLEDIKNVEHHLEKYSIAHHFNSSVLTSIQLTENERTEFTYARMTFTENVIEALNETKASLQKGEERIDQAKDHFRRFIRRDITEPKLREMAREGIEVKTTYKDILNHQANMLKTLESADRYARDFISKNDELVQAFINSIHNHLITVIKQLKVIPKHTRVKVGEQWREIYRFNIPEWTEEEGKTRIRNYMDWILEQLESDRFHDSHGVEDTGQARKEIETWLDTKQLLQVVMENQAMKVSCRKVTNDNKVTQRLTTWEQSNKWSGGEKWSKNMTLFLGILNFVAEKKQHINKSTKRHRAVILDNPFGKASSDHVLSPVFFIAEQLGFQIIALTAHADGKFLQDYFPIIYSLRLRAASDGRKQVVDKTKSLHHAYFQDHEPRVIERLEEQEQMQLF